VRLNGADCYTKREAEQCETAGNVWFNVTCYNASQLFELDVCPSTAPHNCTPYNRTSAAEEYFKYERLPAGYISRGSSPNIPGLAQ